MTNEQWRTLNVRVGTVNKSLPRWLPGGCAERSANAWPALDLWVPGASSERWIARKHRSPASEARREFGVLPRLSSPRPSERSGLGLVSRYDFYQPASSLWRSSASTDGNRRGAIEQ